MKNAQAFWDSSVIVPLCCHQVTSHPLRRLLRQTSRLLVWWGAQGCRLYPTAEELLLLSEGGGSNRARTYLFKADLLSFTAATGLTVRVAHYPPYTSKWNPLEHGLFPHLTRACAGVVLTRVELARELMSGARTARGREVRVPIWHKVYEKGRQGAEELKEEMR